MHQDFLQLGFEKHSDLMLHDIGQRGQRGQRSDQPNERLGDLAALFLRDHRVVSHYYLVTAKVAVLLRATFDFFTFNGTLEFDIEHQVEDDFDQFVHAVRNYLALSKFKFSLQINDNIALDFSELQHALPIIACLSVDVVPELSSQFNRWYLYVQKHPIASWIKQGLMSQVVEQSIRQERITTQVFHFSQATEKICFLQCLYVLQSCDPPTFFLDISAPTQLLKEIEKTLELAELSGVVRTCTFLWLRCAWPAVTTDVFTKLIAHVINADSRVAEINDDLNHFYLR